jgi:large subunit ribosomal protein L15
MGWGQIGQHRKHGEKGGRKVGRHKHLWSYVINYEPDYFGKKGFKTPQSIKGKTRPINVGQVDQLIAKLSLEGQLAKKDGKPYIDLDAIGYGKLLATGNLTKPAMLKVASYSENAFKKVEEAGGKIIGEPKEETEEKEEKPEKTEKAEEGAA